VRVFQRAGRNAPLACEVQDREHLLKGKSMNTGKRMLAAFSLLAVAGLPAYAGEAAAGKDLFTRLDKDRSGTLSRAEYQAWSGSASAVAVVLAPAGTTRASALIGKDVLGRNGEELGEIKDVVIDLNAGKVHAAVLEFGGTLGLGEKHYAFPVSQLQPGKKSGQLVLNVDKDKLKDAQGFAKGQWPAMDDEYWGRVGSRAKTASAGTSAKGHGQKARLVRASDMIGKEIQGTSGNEVGEIRDLTISMKDGAVRNVLVDVKDAGQAMLKTSALKTGTDGKLLVDSSHEQLKKQAQQARPKG
jgi:sporulation protein YlmC with PRC-barrel domain